MPSPLRPRPGPLVLAFLLGCATVSFLAPASSASPGSKLDAANRRLSALTTRIKEQETQATDMVNKLAVLGTKIEAASRVEGRIAGGLVATQQRIADATNQETHLQDQIDSIAQTLYMQGGLQAGFLEPLLSSTSMAEFGDRLAFAQAVGQSSVDLANQVAGAKALLDAQAEELGRLQAQQVQLLDDLNQARADKGKALVEQQQALAGLDRTKNSIVSLIVSLHRQLLAQELTGIGNAFQGDGHISYGAWAGLFLKTMGVSGCHENKVVLVAWQYAEFTQAAWNPLATTHQMPGSTLFSSFGIQNFPSLDVGLQASKLTIDGGLDRYGYRAIVDALARCADAMTTARAVNASSWCRGCTYGMYVTGNIPKVEANYDVYAAL
jgi:peptidoglycan hydrolase CwlO-like protein